LNQFLSADVVHCERDGRNYSDIHCLECASSKWDTEKGIICEFHSPLTVFDHVNLIADSVLL